MVFVWNHDVGLGKVIEGTVWGHCLHREVVLTKIAIDGEFRGLSIVPCRNAVNRMLVEIVPCDVARPHVCPEVTATARRLRTGPRTQTLGFHALFHPAVIKGTKNVADITRGVGLIAPTTTPG